VCDSSVGTRKHMRLKPRQARKTLKRKKRKKIKSKWEHKIRKTGNQSETLPPVLVGDPPNKEKAIDPAQYRTGVTCRSRGGKIRGWSDNIGEPGGEVGSTHMTGTFLREPSIVNSGVERVRPIQDLWSGGGSSPAKRNESRKRDGDNHTCE